MSPLSKFQRFIWKGTYDVAYLRRVPPQSISVDHEETLPILHGSEEVTTSFHRRWFGLILDRLLGLYALCTFLWIWNRINFFEQWRVFQHLFLSKKPSKILCSEFFLISRVFRYWSRKVPHFMAELIQYIVFKKHNQSTDYYSSNFLTGSKLGIRTIDLGHLYCWCGE